LKDAWGFAKGVVEFIIAHKEEIAIAFGAKTAIGAGKDAVGMAKGIGGAAEGIGGAMGMAGMAGTVAGLGVLAAAIIAVGAAAYITAEIMRDNADREDTRVKGMAARKEMAMRGDVEGLQNEYETEGHKQDYMLENQGQQSDQDWAEAKNRLADIVARLEEAKSVRAAMDAAATDNINAITQAGFETADAYDQAAADHSAASMAYADEVAAKDVAAIVQAYNYAASVHDEAAMMLAADTINGSTHLQKAFFESGLTISGGLEGLANQLLESSGEFAAALRKQGGDVAGKAPEKPKFSLSGGGPVTINIKQDFRDQDPERIFLVFKKDLVKLSENRIQSTGGIPGGL
jgi:hypothetical protein